MLLRGERGDFAVDEGEDPRSDKSSDEAERHLLVVSRQDISIAHRGHRDKRPDGVQALGEIQVLPFA